METYKIQTEKSVHISWRQISRCGVSMVEKIFASTYTQIDFQLYNIHYHKFNVYIHPTIINVCSYDANPKFNKNYFLSKNTNQCIFRACITWRCYQAALRICLITPSYFVLRPLPVSPFLVVFSSTSWYYLLSSSAAVTVYQLIGNTHKLGIPRRQHCFFHCPQWF